MGDLMTTETYGMSPALQRKGGAARNGTDGTLSVGDTNGPFVGSGGISGRVASRAGGAFRGGACFGGARPVRGEPRRAVSGGGGRASP